MSDSSKNEEAKIAIYGGNGFVGTHIAKELASRNIAAVCVSRTGHKPLHLKDQSWSESIRWCKGDASTPDRRLLSDINTLIVCVGSPPLPTWSKKAYEQQVFANGTSNVNVIEAAGKAGVMKIILLGANLPLLLRNDRFGYYKGKKMALQAASEFAQLSENHRALILQPGAIFGTRHLANGKALPLYIVMKPLSYLMPWQFICVDRIARRVADEIGQRPPYPPLTVLKNSQI